MRRSLDSDFRRFRERGDVPALERVFDGTAPELLRIARHLAPDATSADDLVQATWVVALENCARWDSARPLLPWLIGVLAREAARARRDAARRVDPERLDSRVVVEPGQGLESDELRDAVRSALADLPEQERRVLEPHLLEGRRAFELAEDLGCAPGTVRVRISRGLARLRRALPSGLASGAALVALEGRGEAFVRRAVLQRGAELAPQLAAAAPLAVSTPVVLGGILMQSKVLYALVGLVAACVLWTELPSEAPLEPPPSVELPAARLDDVAVDDPERTASSVGDGQRAAVDDEAESQLDGPKVAVYGLGPAAAGDGTRWLVRGQLEGFLAEHHDFEAARAEWDPVISVREATSNERGVVRGLLRATGAFEVEITGLVLQDGPLTRKFVLKLDHAVYRSVNEEFRLTAEERDLGRGRVNVIDLDVRLEPAGVIEGVVALPADWGRGSVHVALFDVDATGQPVGEPVAQQALGDPRRYRFEQRGPGEVMLLAVADGLQPAWSRVRVEGHVVTTAPELSLAAGPIELRGHVTLGRDRSPAGALLGAGLEPGETDFRERLCWFETCWWFEGSFHAMRQTAVVDEEGRFRVTGLESGSYRLRVEDTGDGEVLCGQSAEVQVVAPNASVKLGAQLARLEVHLTTEGEPVAAQNVQFRFDGGECAATTDAAGRCVVWLDAFSEVLVAIRGEGFEPLDRTVSAGAGREEALHLELVRAASRRATLALRIDARSARELDSLQVDLLPLGLEGSWSRASAARDEAGEFVFEDLEPGRYRLRVEPNEAAFGPAYASFRRFPTRDVELSPGGRHELDLVAEVGGRVTVRVLGAAQGEDQISDCRVERDDGEAVGVMFFSQVYEGNTLRLGATNDALPAGRESTVYPNLAPGRYWLVIEDESYEPVRAELRIVAGESSPCDVLLAPR